MLTIRNRESGTELQGQVVDMGGEQAGKIEVGIEFPEPSPRFWRIAFPPEDWSARSPEAKGFVTQPVSPLKARLPK